MSKLTPQFKAKLEQARLKYQEAKELARASPKTYAQRLQVASDTYGALLYQKTRLYIAHCESTKHNSR
jgi:hypothetical protein